MAWKRERSGWGRKAATVRLRKGRGGATGSICRPYHWSGNSWGRIAPSSRHSALKSPAKFPGGRNGHEAQQPLTVPQFHTPPNLQAGVCQGSSGLQDTFDSPFPTVAGWCTAGPGLSGEAVLPQPGLQARSEAAKQKPSRFLPKSPL